MRNKLQVADVAGGIDLTQDHLHGLARAASDRTGKADRPFGIYLFANTDPCAELARAVERRVFDHAYGNTPSVMSVEYGPYETNSVFVTIIDHRRLLPVAAIRFITAGGLGWKTLDDLGRFWQIPGPRALAQSGITVDPTRLWDCASLAVEPTYRRGGIVQALFGSISCLAWMAGVEIIIAMIDCRVLRVAQALCDRPWRVFEGFEAKRYLDSPLTVPIWTDVGEYRTRLQRTGSTHFDAMFNPSYYEPAVAGLTPSDLEALSAGKGVGFVPAFGDHPSPA
ncbi:MAG: hypothetical protein AB7I04_25055 [Pseudomonadales bacterium]